ncbi:MAG TPA: selenium cofactor biosynthesis protein YqeC [Verrucomicrobiae bacterium]|nr:selenium cofactor biosynthesis protein YqeC [Verrucomicrobiae bacterium]
MDKVKPGLCIGNLFSMTNFAPVTTFIGAGGKTTCLLSLAREISLRNEKVIATTSTKVFPLSYLNVVQNEVLPESLEYPCFWAARHNVESGKWEGPQIQSIDAAIKLRNALNGAKKEFWVIEGDGAKGQKLKFWASHEPQIPSYTECAVLVVDGGLWNKTIKDEDVHRGERGHGFVGRAWNNHQAWQYLMGSPVFYSRYQKLNWVILFNEFGQSLNKVDLTELAHTEIAGFGNPAERIVRPQHLRLAAGNGKEGTIRWLDLW